MGCHNCCHFTCSDKNIIDFECPKCERYILLCYGEDTCECAGEYGIILYCPECKWEESTEEYEKKCQDIIETKIHEIMNIMEIFDSNKRQAFFDEINNVIEKKF